MICLLNIAEKPVKTNEEYCNMLNKQNKIFLWVIPLGLLTAGLAIINEIFHLLGNNSWFNGVCTGVGAGVVFVGLFKVLRNRKVMKDEDRLKEERLKMQDERNRMIAGKAVQSTMLVVLAFSYVIMIIAGFLNRAVFITFWFMIILFFVSYQIFVKFYNKRL